MTTFEVIQALASLAALILSLVSISIAKSSSQTAKDLHIKTFQRQGVIDLYGHWVDIRDIDMERGKQVDPDITKAVHMLELTAALWNHDIVTKDILYQGFWDNFKTLYEKLNDPSAKLEHRNDAPSSSLLTVPVKKCYQEMNNHDLSNVKASTI